MPKLVRVIVLAVVLAVVLAAVPAVVPAVDGMSAASPAHVLIANRRAAVGAADQLLNEVALPPGATEVPSEPAGDAHQLARAIQLDIYAAEVDRHQFWTTAASPAAVIASFEADLPAGATSTGSGSAGSSMFVSYALPAVGAPAVGPRDLAVDAVELANGSTGVRADAQVRFDAPRLPAQRVPARARVLESTMTASPFGPPGSDAPKLPPPVTVTKRSQVRAIAAIVDGLPFAAALKGVAIACPDIMPAPIVTFTFRAAPIGPPLATVSEAANTPAVAEPCFTTALAIGAHREPGLLEGGTLLRKAGAILGVKLTTRS